MLKKLLVTVLILVLCVTSLTGCKEKVTAEGILLKASMNTKDAKSMSANMVMDMIMSYDMEGVTGKISMVMDIDMDIQTEPMAMYMNMAMNMDADGVTEEQSYEVYAETGETAGEMIVYTGMEDVWYKETTPSEEYASLGEQIYLPAGFNENEDVIIELAEETVTVNGQEAYLLKGSIKGETLQTMLSSVKDLEEVFGANMDLSNAEATIDYAVYKESFIPAEMNIDMSECMAGLLVDTGMTFEKVTLKYTFESFDQNVVAVPDTIKETAIDATALEEEVATEEDMEYAEDVLVDSTDAAMTWTKAEVTAPASLEEWSSTYALLDDGTYFQVAARVVGIKRGQEVDEVVKNINDTAGTEVLGPLHENLEYCLVGYEVYVPTDYPAESFQGVELYVTDTEGMYFETEYEFDDMYWVEIVDDSMMYVAPGETAQVVGIYTMEKDRTEYLFEIGDSWFNETYVKITE